MNDFEELNARLLAIAGESVLATTALDLNVLLERGRAYEATGRKRVKGMRHHCVALHYLTRHLHGPGDWFIATGYGLTDGVWLPHSWLWDGRRVVDTNGDHEWYFGVVLNHLEAAAFTIKAALHIVPRGEDLVLSQSA